MTLPRAEIVHQMPGRLRVRVADRRNNREYFARVREALATMEGVQSVETNWASGSVLLLHDSTADNITQFARERDLFDVHAPQWLAPAVSQRIAQGAGSVVHRVNRFTRGEVDVPGIVVIGFATAGLVQVLRRNAWPPGMTLFWYAAILLKDVASAAARDPGKPWDRDQTASQYVQ